MKSKKSQILIFLLAISISLFYSFDEKGKEILPIGSLAPNTNVKMKDVSDKEISLEDIKQKNGLLVIFSSNTCPFVIAWEDRYPELGAVCVQKGIGMVLVNSNEAKRSGADSMEEMKKHFKEKKYNSYYVLDVNSAIANAFGAKTTPHVFLFDKDLKLVYSGAIDDNSEDAKKVKQPYLLNAINNLVSGMPISPSETKAVGCSIKRLIN